MITGSCYVHFSITLSYEWFSKEEKKFVIANCLEWKIKQWWGAIYHIIFYYFWMLKICLPVKQCWVVAPTGLYIKSTKWNSWTSNCCWLPIGRNCPLVTERVEESGKFSTTWLRPRALALRLWTTHSNRAMIFVVVSHVRGLGMPVSITDVLLAPGALNHFMVWCNSGPQPLSRAGDREISRPHVPQRQLNGVHGYILAFISYVLYWNT